EASWCKDRWPATERRTCVEQRSRVRSSSNCKCGRWRWKKKRSCSVCACSPARVRKARDRRLTIAEDAFSRGRVEPFGQRRQHHRDLLGGSFQTVQRRVASSAERGAANLTAESLDLLSLTMLAIPDQCVDVRIGDPAVRALLIGTSEAFGLH